MSKLLGKILKWLTYVAAASIMMLALLVGVARLFLPLIQEYQEDIRLWASEVTGVEVRFESISASWPFAGPEIELIGVTVSAPGSGERIVALEKLSVGISLVRLLRDREALVDRLGISGAELRVERTDDGRILLQGLPPEQFWGGEAGAVSRPTIPDLRLKLADIEVAFSDATRSADIYQIGLSQLAIQLGDDNLDIEADINLPAEFGGRLQVSAGLPTLLLDTGPEETVPEKVNRRGTRKRLPAKWQAYFEGEELNLEPILSYWVERDFPISDAKGDMSLRATFEDRTPIKLSAELDIDTPVFRIGPEEVRQYEALKGRFEWEKLESGWQLAGSDLGILSRDLLSPDLFGDRSDFSLTYDQLADTNEQRLVFSTKFFRLQDFYPLIRVAESEGLLSGAVSADTPLPQAVYGDLLAINLSVLQTAGVFSDLAVAGEFKDFGVTGFAGGDSLTGFSGRVAGSDNRGVFELNTRNAELDLPSIFIQPLQMESLNGSFAFEIDTDWFRIVSGSARIGNSFAQLNVRLMLDWPRVSGQAPLIDLQASGQATNAPDVITALPLNKFSPAVSAWLQSSVLAGRVDQVGLQLQGPLNAFPFAEEQGIFRVDIDIAEGVFSYAPEWPRIDRLQGRLVLEGPGLYSVENSGVTGGVEFENADIKLLDFGEGLLEVRASQSVQVPAILNYLQLSPIAQAVGKVLEDATGSGSVMADFSLSLPVSKPDLFDLNIDLVAEDVALGLTGLDWGLARLAGEVSVRNTRFYANNLAGMLLDEPVRLDLWPAQPESSNQQFIKVSGRTPIERWMQTLSLPFAENISGATDWQALTVIPDSDLENERPVSIIVRSDLAGVTSDLPVPLGKAADAQDRFEAEVSFPADGVLEVKGNYREQYSWAVSLVDDEEGWLIDRGAVHAGAAPAILPMESGVELSGSVAELNFDDWLDLAEEDSESNLQDIYREAAFDIDDFTLFSHRFYSVQLDVQRADGWEIQLSGPGIVGEARVPFDLESDVPSQVNFEQLWLDEPVEEGTGQDDPRSVVAMDIKVGDFSIAGMRFGALTTQVRKVTGGVRVEPIRTQTEAFTVQGEWTWLVHPNDDTLQQSNLKLTLDGSDVSKTLERLGYEVVMSGGSIKITGDLNWRGGPDSTFLERSDGQVNVALGEGAILVVDPGGGGRMLGVLSLASLPRRLSLDFSDVVNDGLAFDELSGQFTLDDGNAYTCDLNMEGPVADMAIIGRAGIAERDYEQIAVVRPHVENLFTVGGAAAGTVVGGPIGGAAMLLFSRIFRKPFSDVGESYYSVTGSWDSPVVTQIKGNDFDPRPIRNCKGNLADAITESLKE